MPIVILVLQRRGLIQRNGLLTRPPTKIIEMVLVDQTKARDTVKQLEPREEVFTVGTADYVVRETLGKPSRSLPRVLAFEVQATDNEIKQLAIDEDASGSIAVKSRSPIKGL